MNRRSLIASILALSTAGCQSSREDSQSETETSRVTETQTGTETRTATSTRSPTPTDTETETERSGPPYFEDVEIEVPDTATVMGQWMVTVAVTNTGGRVGDYTAGLRSPFETESVVIEDVQPGERKSVELGPFYSTRAGDIEFRIPSAAVGATITITAAELDLGQSFELGEIEVSASNPRVRESVFVNDSEAREKQTQVTQAEEEMIYLFVDARSNAEYADESDFTLNGRQQAEVTPINLDQDRYGYFSNGFVLFTVPRSELRKEWNLAYSPQESGPPEVRWTGQSLTLPDLDIVEVDIPEKAEIDQEDVVSAVVENTGDGRGTFRAALHRSNLDITFGGRNEPVEVEEPVAPGERKEVQISEPVGKMNEFEYTLYTGDGPYTGTTLYEARQLNPGEGYKSYYGLDVTVEQISKPTARFTWSQGSDSGSKEYDDYQAVFAYFRAENNTDSSVAGLQRGDLRLVHPDIPEDTRFEYEQFRIYHDREAEIDTPVSGPQYPLGEWIKSGNSREGFLYAAVPDTATADELVVRYDEPSSQRAAEWSRS